MKLRTLLLLCFAAALTGCGKESVESGESPVTTPDGIRFATLVSRGSAVTTVPGLAQAGGFDVWFYSHPEVWSAPYAKDPMVPAGTPVTSADGGASWDYGTPVDWPQNGDYVSFFAYAPEGAAQPGTPTAAGVPTIDFTVDPDVMQQKDLLVADHLYDQSGSNYSFRSVNLSFRHALSRVSFSAVLTGQFADVDKAVQVRRVTLRNVYSTGTAALLTPVVWTDVSQPASYTVEIGSGLLDDTLESASKAISSADGMLFLMPQTVGRGIDRIEMDVTLLVDGEETNYTTPIFSPVLWESGRSYNYQIEVDAGAIRVIEIDSSTTLDPWVASIAIQSVIMTHEQSRDEARFYASLANLNAMKVFRDGFFQWLGLYATHDLDNDITIDLNDSRAKIDQFSKDDYLVFDFKKVVSAWLVDSLGVPFTVTVLYDTTEWALSPSCQTAPLDAYTGATVQNTSNKIQNKGSIILQKIK